MLGIEPCSKASKIFAHASQLKQGSTPSKEHYNKVTRIYNHVIQYSNITTVGEHNATSWMGIMTVLSNS